MVDTELIVSNSDTCRAFRLRDAVRIRSAAIIQDYTMIGYYVNISLRVATYEGREGQEEKEDVDSRLETGLLFVGSCFISSCSSNEDIFGRTIHNVMLTEWLDISGFVMLNSVPPLQYLC